MPTRLLPQQEVDYEKGAFGHVIVSREEDELKYGCQDPKK
jgi:hypothetical protein